MKPSRSLSGWQWGRGYDTEELHRTDLYSLWLSVTNTWKYGISALAILLLLVALTILACQMCQLQKHKSINKKKKYHSQGCVKREAEKGTSGKKIPPSLLDMAKQNTDLKIEKLRAELDKPSACLSFSSTRTENLNGVSSDSDFLHSSQGKLKFSLLYCRERCELLLTGLEARGPPSRGRAKSAVRIRLLRQVPSRIPGLQYMVHEWQSQVVKNCGRPAFGDKFVCSLRDTEVEKSTLKLEVQCFDKYSRNAVLGEVRVALRDLKASQSLVLCEELQKSTKDVVGEVLVSLKCLPISQRREVGLLKAKTAPPCSTANKNVHARIDVSCRRHKQKPQKSRPRAHAPLIVFNETFLFHMPEPSAWDCTVLVSTCEADSDPRHLIGQATLGNNRASDAADHWHLMRKSVQQPVAKRHPLLI